MTENNPYAQLRALIETLKDQGYVADLYPERGPYTWGWSNERLGLRSTTLGYERVTSEMLAWRQCVEHCLKSGTLPDSLLPKT